MKVAEDWTVRWRRTKFWRNRARVGSDANEWQKRRYDNRGGADAAYEGMCAKKPHGWRIEMYCGDQLIQSFAGIPAKRMTP